MPEHKLSRRADQDLVSIFVYTVQAFGTAQALAYKADLEAAFALLAANPAMGRKTDDVREGLRRHQHGRHIIFYIGDAPVDIVRILPDRSDWREAF